MEVVPWDLLICCKWSFLCVPTPPDVVSIWLTKERTHVSSVTIFLYTFSATFFLMGHKLFNVPLSIKTKWPEEIINLFKSKMIIGGPKKKWCFSKQVVQNLFIYTWTWIFDSWCKYWLKKSWTKSVIIKYCLIWNMY